MLKIIIGSLAALVVANSAQATEEILPARIECSVQKHEGDRYLIAVDFSTAPGLKLKNARVYGNYRPATVTVTATNGKYSGHSVTMMTQFMKSESSEDMSTSQFSSLNSFDFVLNGFMKIEMVAEGGKPYGLYFLEDAEVIDR